MNSTYAQKSSTVQKAADSKAASVLDSSAQGESLQRKADMTSNATQRAEAPRPNNTGMPDNLKAGIESLSGFSMDDVRVHYNSSKPATVQALAYTQGTDIHVAPGQEKHLPHEAWHVAQQMAGRVSPTTNINGMPVNDNAALEHEADVMGEKAVGQRYWIRETIDDSSIKNNAIQSYLILKKQKLYANAIQRVTININGNDEFKKKIEGAITELENTKAPYYLRIKDCSEKDYFKSLVIENGEETNFIAPATDSENPRIEVNIKQCQNMFFSCNKNLIDDVKNMEKTEVIIGQPTICSVLLHELGHAYQCYLLGPESYKAKNIPKTEIESIESLPLLNEFLNNTNLDDDKDETKIEELRQTLDFFGIKKKNLDETKKFLKKIKTNPDDSAVKAFFKKLTEVGWGSPGVAFDADNMLMNENPYNRSNGLMNRDTYLHTLRKDSPKLNYTYYIYDLVRPKIQDCIKENKIGKKEIKDERQFYDELKKIINPEEIARIKPHIDRDMIANWDGIYDCPENFSRYLYNYLDQVVVKGNSECLLFGEYNKTTVVIKLPMIIQDHIYTWMKDHKCDLENIDAWMKDHECDLKNFREKFLNGNYDSDGMEIVAQNNPNLKIMIQKLRDGVPS